MQKLVPLIAISLVTLGSCVGLQTFPPPQTADDSLVVGWLRIDFPDGFFRDPPLSIKANIEVLILDWSTGKELSVWTRADGMFLFSCTKVGKYALVGYKCTVYSGPVKYTLGGKLNYPWRMTPGRIIYVGDHTVTEAKPRVEENNMSTTGRSSWSYNMSVNRTLTPDTVLPRLRQLYPNLSPWLDREVLTAE